MQRVENDCRIRDTADMGDSLEQMARSLVESGDYRVTSRLEPRAEYYPPDDSPKLVAAVVDVPQSIGSAARFDINWKAEGIRSSALEFIGYSLGFFHDGHRAASDCRGHPSCAGTTAPRYRTTRIADSLENRRDCRLGGYGRGMLLLRRRMSSRPEVTPGAPENSGDRDAGIATWRTPIRRQRCRGSEQT